jgi:uncharacterized protein (TIGR03492 family)
LKAPRQKPVLLLSNGHGEDLSGAKIAEALMARGIAVEALPLVGHGHPYRQAGVPVLGRTRECSTGGLGYTSLAGQLREIGEGQWTYLLGRLLWLARHRKRFQRVVGVGDLVAVLGAWLGGPESAVYLVAYSSHYEGRLRLPWPCGVLLRSPRIAQIWSRDPLTARQLSDQLGKPVVFAGNPFLDGVIEPAQPSEQAKTEAQSLQSLPPALGFSQNLALLPGSRLPEALHNLGLMLQVVSRLPSALHQGHQQRDQQQRGQRLRIQAALVASLTSEAIEAMAAPLGWQLDSRRSLLRRGPWQVELGWGEFAAMLNRTDLALASAGTASEQAVGLGKPVLQLCGRGPQFTAGFAEAQRRLLGPGVSCAPGKPGSAAVLQATADLAAQQLDALADPEAGPAWRRQLAALGAERIGSAGGSAQIATAIMERITATAGQRHG